MPEIDQKKQEQRQSFEADYEVMEIYYKSLQTELFDLLNKELDSDEEIFKGIGISEISARPAGKIKKISAIVDNIEKYNKYEGSESLFEIHDIAGIRVTCFTSEDEDKASAKILNILRQEGYDVDDPDKKGGGNNTGKSQPAYRGTHLIVGKVVHHPEKGDVKLKCEIQIRTVMAHAWATLDRKYVYGVHTEGEIVQLTDALSTVIRGVDDVWSLVKHKAPSAPSAINSHTASELSQLSTPVMATEKADIVYPVQNEDKDFFDNEWFNGHKQHAYERGKKSAPGGFMEVSTRLLNSSFRTDVTMLRSAASESTISTFGWPVALYMESPYDPKLKPRVNKDGVYAEIEVERESQEMSYDYWALNKKGDAFIVQSYFEDQREESGIIYFDTRVVRITESLMYIRNLYTALEVSDATEIQIRFEHNGLMDRTLGAANRFRSLSYERVSGGDDVCVVFTTTLGELKNDLTPHVAIVTQELFSLFDGFELAADVLNKMVVAYESGNMP